MEEREREREGQLERERERKEGDGEECELSFELTLFDRDGLPRSIVLGRFLPVSLILILILREKSSRDGVLSVSSSFVRGGGEGRGGRRREDGRGRGDGRLGLFGSGTGDLDDSCWREDGREHAESRVGKELSERFVFESNEGREGERESSLFDACLSSLLRLLVKLDLSIRLLLGTLALLGLFLLWSRSFLLHENGFRLRRRRSRRSV